MWNTFLHETNPPASASASTSALQMHQCIVRQIYEFTMNEKFVIQRSKDDVVNIDVDKEIDKLPLSLMLIIEVVMF